MAGGSTSRRTDKRRRCDRGRSCPYLHEHQHVLEYRHDGVNDGEDGKNATGGRGSTSSGYHAFSGGGRAVGGGASRRRRADHDGGASLSARAAEAAAARHHAAPSIPSSSITASMPQRSSAVDRSDVPELHDRTNEGLRYDSKGPQNEGWKKRGKRGVVEKKEEVLLLDDDSEDDDDGVDRKRRTDNGDGQQQSRGTVDLVSSPRDNDVSLVDLCDDDEDVCIVDSPQHLSSRRKRRRVGGRVSPVHGVRPPIEPIHAGLADPGLADSLAQPFSPNLGGAPVRGAAEDDEEERRHLSRAIANSNRDVRIEQDREFEESLRADREKERAKREEDDMAKAIEASRQAGEEEEKRRREEERRRAAATLEAEPDDDTDGGVATVAFRLPPKCGKARIVRKFRGDASANQLFAYLRSCDELEAMSNWTLRTVLGAGEIAPGSPGADNGKTLKDLGLAPRGMLVVRDEDS